MDVKDIELWANTKYQSQWSAHAAVSQLDRAKLSVIVQVFSKGKLDQLVKVRLLISCCLLPAHRKTELADLLTQLAVAARGDEDEFVRVTGHAVGDFSGQLDLSAVMAENSMVQETAQAVLALLDHAQPQASFMPMQEMYMHPDIRARCLTASSSQKQQLQQQHFRARQGPEASSALPDFSLETLLGGGGMPDGSLSSPTGAGAGKDKTDLAARRGTGVSAGTGLWIKKGPLTRPSLHTSNPAAMAGVEPPPEGDGAPRHLPGLVSRQRASKTLAVPVGEAASLQRRGANLTPSLLGDAGAAGGPPHHASSSMKSSDEMGAAGQGIREAASVPRGDVEGVAGTGNATEGDRGLNNEAAGAGTASGGQRGQPVKAITDCGDPGADSIGATTGHKRPRETEDADVQEF